MEGHILRKWASTQIGSLELVTYITSILWGLWIANPWWSPFRENPGFSVMLRVGEEFLGLDRPRYFWGAIPILLPLVIIGSIYLYGERAATFRKLAAGALFMFWVWVVVSFAMANPQTAAIVAYGQYAILYAWIFIIQSRRGRGRHEL